jgi:hypothetical protein
MWPPSGLQTITEHEIKKKKHSPALQPNDSMKYSPSASQESSGVLYMRTIYCRVYKNPLATAILNQVKEVHKIPPYLFSIHFSSILIPTPTSFLHIFRPKPVHILFPFNDFNPSHHSRFHDPSEILPRTHIVQLLIV